VRSFCWYPGLTASRIVSAVKYQGWHVAAEEIAARMARLNFPADVREEAPSLIPVPLSPSRERDRGYNQSELLARSLARRWGLPLMVNCLRRCRTTVSQTKLTPAERAHNVAGAFSVAAESASSLQGAHLLLVDDVVTTSATLNECAAALFEAGARIVSYVTFGRAPSPGDMPLGPGQ
jgi:ComF family protein